MGLPRRTLLAGLGLAACARTPESPGPTGSTAPVATEEPDRAPADHATPTAAVEAPTAPPTAAEAPPSLAGDQQNTWAFAPLDRPDDVVVEGAAPSQRAWSTSKVLVVCAYLRRVARGDPDRLDATGRAAITAALTASDAAALRTLRASVPSLTTGMTDLLRSVGDTTTTVQSPYEGTTTWTVREQVRFMAALAAGRVVTPATSAYVLAAMQPVASQRWGLPGVGATATKGGWLRADTETRQMGVLAGHAVAILTAGVGPAVRQSDGDSAHVAQLDTLAGLLRRRLG